MVNFAKSLGKGAVGGAVSGGFSSFGTSLATNIGYGTLGNMASYTAASMVFENGPVPPKLNLDFFAKANKVIRHAGWCFQKV